MIFISLFHKSDIENYFYYLIFIIFFSIVFSYKKEPIKKDDIPIFILLFISNITIMFIENNLIYNGILYFNFEDASYSKPLTLYYAISVLFFVNSIKQTKKTIYKVLQIILTLLSLYLAIMSGGRAEIICLLIAIGFTLRKHILSILFVSIVLFIIVNLTFDNEVLQKFNGISRLINSFDFSNNSVLSMRDILILIFINNIDVDCFILGCGINSFQLYNNLSYGLYPHNIILEIIHTIGLVGLFLFLILFYKAAKKLNELEKSTLFLILLISLLSGQLITNFLLFYFLNTSDKSSN